MELRVCRGKNGCGRSLDLTNFSKGSIKCKDCAHKYNKMYNAKNNLKIRTHQKKYALENKEAKSRYQKAYVSKNREDVLEYGRIYRIENKEDLKKQHAKIRAQNREEYAASQRQYRLENRDFLKQKRKENAEVYREYNRKSRKKNLHQRLIKDRISIRIRTNLKQSGLDKKDKSSKYLGCLISEFTSYLESLFTDGMSWNNIGAWQMDHIMPISFFDLTIVENQYKAFHWSNMQPLWKTSRIINGIFYLGNLNKNDLILYHDRVWNGSRWVIDEFHNIMAL